MSGLASIADTPEVVAIFGFGPRPDAEDAAARRSCYDDAVLGMDRPEEVMIMSSEGLSSSDAERLRAFERPRS